MKVVHIESGEPYDVYIGRPSVYGSPIALYQKCPECGDIHSKAGDTIYCYRRYLNRRMAKDEKFSMAVRGLRGKTLACWCKPGPCHGDILWEMANG